MLVLVTYASKHGATQGIAEHIGWTLREAGHDAVIRPVRDAGDLSRYDAFVVGSAVFLGSWMKEATDFVRRNQATLAARPTWLFSSGPIGAKLTDDEGRDLRETSKPKQLDELVEMLDPRGHRVFFGALRRKTLTVCERVLAALPAGKEVLPEGDFRDWDDIERWARDIGAELELALAGSTLDPALAVK
jgi:menaquinone-dependent protoporphyrinogen oxidase